MLVGAFLARGLKVGEKSHLVSTLSLLIRNMYYRVFRIKYYFYLFLILRRVLDINYLIKYQMKPAIQCHIRKDSSMSHILSQINPIFSHSKTHANIIFPSPPKSS